MALKMIKKNNHKQSNTPIKMGKEPIRGRMRYIILGLAYVSRCYPSTYEI